MECKKEPSKVLQGLGQEHPE